MFLIYRLLFIPLLLLLLNYCENKEKTTETGLKYLDLEIGKGDYPQPGDRISISYVGMLMDGKLFHSSFNTIGENIPAVFRLDRDLVIKAWHEGVKTMKIGGKRKLIIPPNLGYGNEGFERIVSANDTIIYEIELLKIEKVPTPPKIKLPKEGKIVTKSGLEYYDVVVGDGRAMDGPLPRVFIKFRAQLPDGRQFDSNMDSSPFDFVLGWNEVIKGLEEGVASMRIRGERILVIPPELGYGNVERGIIPPNSTLIFEVHLIAGR